MEFCIDDDLYNKVEDYCLRNTIDINEYLNDCIVKQFNIDKYGDLNVIIDNKFKKDIKENFTIKEILFDETKKSYIVKHNLGDDILIPISMTDIEKIYNASQLNIDNINLDKEIRLMGNVDESKLKEDINTIKKRKRTIKTK